MKIALCKTSIFGPISGADETMLNYALHLQQTGHDVSVVLLYPPSVDDQYLRRLRLKGISVQAIVPRSYLFALLRVFRSLLTSALFFLFFVKRAPGGLRKIWQVAVRAITQLHYRDCRAYFAAARPDLFRGRVAALGTAVHHVDDRPGLCEAFADRRANPAAMVRHEVGSGQQQQFLR